MSFFAEDKELSDSLEERRLNSPRDARESLNFGRDEDEPAFFGNQ